MVRTEDDSWGITESVGSTALNIAAARAAETESSHPLIDDPYARMFLDAAGPGPWSAFDITVSSHATAQFDAELTSELKLLVDVFVVRTAFIDDFFTAAAAAGLRQIVILAAGLDSRAWRLPWPDGTRLYELDQPKVLDFKTAVLDSHAAVPRADRVGIAVDLRNDWPAALQQAGFDRRLPTAWCAEGLLRYLPAAAQDQLFERIDQLSSAGSRLVANAPSSEAHQAQHLARERELTRRAQAAADRLGADTTYPEPDQLWYPEERGDVAQWWGDRGWRIDVEAAAEAVLRYGRGGDIRALDAAPPVVFLSAELPHRREDFTPQ